MKKIVIVVLSLAVLALTPSCITSALISGMVEAATTPTLPRISVLGFSLPGETPMGEVKGSLWEMGDYVDDFGSPTGRHYIYQECIGQFSNSLFSGEELLATVRISQSGTLRFYLYEYGKYKVSGTPSGIDYQIRIVNEDGEQFRKRVELEDVDYFEFSQKDSQTIIDTIATSEKILVQITEKAKYTYSDEYEFLIFPQGLGYAALQLLK